MASFFVETVEMSRRWIFSSLFRQVFCLESGSVKRSTGGCP